MLRCFSSSLYVPRVLASACSRSRRCGAGPVVFPAPYRPRVLECMLEILALGRRLPGQHARCSTSSCTLCVRGISAQQLLARGLTVTVHAHLVSGLTCSLFVSSVQRKPWNFLQLELVEVADMDLDSLQIRTPLSTLDRKPPQWSPARRLLPSRLPMLTHVCTAGAAASRSSDRIATANSL